MRAYIYLYIYIYIYTVGFINPARFFFLLTRFYFRFHFPSSVCKHQTLSVRTFSWRSLLPECTRSVGRACSRWVWGHMCTRWQNASVFNCECFSPSRVRCDVFMFDWEKGDAAATFHRIPSDGHYIQSVRRLQVGVTELTCSVLKDVLSLLFTTSTSRHHALVVVGSVWGIVLQDSDREAAGSGVWTQNPSAGSQTDFHVMLQRIEPGLIHWRCTIDVLL